MPRNLGAFGDHVTAIHLLSGIGLALFHKQRTGRGQLVDACLYRAAIFSAANWANVAHIDVQSAGRKSASNPPLVVVCGSILRDCLWLQRTRTISTG